MEKRLFLAFVITLAFFMVYSHFINKFVPQQAPLQVDSENIVQTTKQFSLQDPQEISPLIQEDEREVANLPQVAIGNFIVTYSPIGGYIKKIFIEGEEKALPFQNIGFLPSDKEKQFSVDIVNNGIKFRGSKGASKEFIFEEDTLKIELNPPPAEPIILFSNFLHSGMDQRYQEVFYSQDKVIKRKAAHKIKDETYNNVEFAGARDRYYCFSLLKGSYNYKWVKTKKMGHFYLFSPPGQILIYIGPQIEKKLKPYELEKVMFYGFFHVIGVGMIKLLYFFYFLTKNWGLSIVFFSSAISLFLFPFTSKSTLAMRKMQQIQPEIEVIKNKYKDNPKKLQKETIELYRKYKVNPLGGCLPLLVQLPIIMAFYQIVFRFVELKGAHFLWITDLSMPDRLFKLPFPAPVNYLNLLPLLLVGIGLLQQKITVSFANTPAQQKSMGLFFTVFIGVIFYTFPSALTLYWLIQNLFTLINQSRLSKAKA